MHSKVLNPLEVALGMKRSILAGVFGSFFGVCIAPQFLTAFAVKLGADKLQVALLTSLPMFGLALQFLATMLTQNLRERKRLWFWIATIHRMIWLAIAAVPFCLGTVGAHATIWVFLGLFFLTSVLGSMSVPLWFSWMADLVPVAQTGKFWARRVAIASLVNVLAIPLGWSIDHFSAQGWLPYVGLFILAAVAGELDLLIHYQVVEPPVTQTVSGEPWWSLIRKPFVHRDFRRLLGFTTSWSFAGAFGDGFVVYFFLTQMKLSLSYIALAASSMWLMRWVMGKYWGFLADRFGHATVLRICSAALVIWPLGLVIWGHSHPKLALLGVHLYMGFFNVGFESCTTGLLLGLSPSVNKSLFVSVFIGTAGLVGGLAPLLSGGFLDRAGATTWLGGHLDAFQVVFLCASLLRLTTIVIFPPVFRNVKTTSPVLLVKRLIDSNPFKVIHHSYVLNDGVHESKRVDAVEKLAQAGSDIATEQLVQAIRDPSLEVRRGAVRALAEIGERSSIPALRMAAESPESQIQVEALEALGTLGDRSVTPLLMEGLHDPQLRLAALRGLGFLKDRAALERVRFLSADEEGPLEVRSTAMETRCALGDESAILPGLQFIRRCNADIPRWQVAIALGRMTVDPVDYYSMLQKELRIRGDSVSKQALKRPFPRWKREGQKRMRGQVEELMRGGQVAYMDGQWARAIQNFTWVAAMSLDLTPTPTSDLVEIHSAIRTTMEDVRATRSQWVLTLGLAEAFFLIEPEQPDVTQEEALLAYGLMLKVQGFDKTQG